MSQKSKAIYNKPILTHNSPNPVYRNYLHSIKF